MSKFASFTEVYVSTGAPYTRQVLVPIAKVTRVVELEGSGHHMYSHGARTIITTGKDTYWYVQESLYETRERLEA